MTAACRSDTPALFTRHGPTVMRIGVVSDTHDRLEAVAVAVRMLTEQQVELILHCGDIESPETVRAFAGVPTHFVFGNWDRDRPGLMAAIKEIGGTYYESFGVIELSGKRIAWVHSHERRQLRQLETADYFDYVFYGHTHVREQHRTGKTLVANPGALVRANPKTCIVLDVTTGELRPLIVSLAPRTVNGTAGPPAAAAPPGSVALSPVAVTNAGPQPGLTDSPPPPLLPGPEPPPG